jgi:hypothetical protein
MRSAWIIDDRGFPHVPHSHVQQQLGQIYAILTGYTGNKSYARHGELRPRAGWDPTFPIGSRGARNGSIGGSVEPLKEATNAGPEVGAGLIPNKPTRLRHVRERPRNVPRLHG